MKLNSFIFNNFICVHKCPMAVKMYPNHGADLLHDASSEKNINYIKMWLKQISLMWNTYPFSITPLVVNKMSFIGLRKCFLNFVHRCPHLPYPCITKKYCISFSFTSWSKITIFYIHRILHGLQYQGRWDWQGI